MTLAPAHARLSTTWVRDWTREGRCSGVDPDTLFVQGKEQRAAKAVCRACPVVAECLADALDTRSEFGVWGGMTERERRALLRRRPDIRDWQAVLSAAKDGRGPALH